MGPVPGDKFPMLDIGVDNGFITAEGVALPMVVELQCADIVDLTRVATALVLPIKDHTSEGLQIGVQGAVWVYLANSPGFFWFTIFAFGDNRDPFSTRDVDYFIDEATFGEPQEVVLCQQLVNLDGAKESDRNP